MHLAQNEHRSMATRGTKLAARTGPSGRTHKATTRNRSHSPRRAQLSDTSPKRRVHSPAVSPILRPIRRWTRTCNGGIVLPHPRPRLNGTNAATSRVLIVGWLMPMTWFAAASATSMPSQSTSIPLADRNNQRLCPTMILSRMRDATRC